MKETNSKKYQKFIESNSPIGRLGKPKEVASIAVDGRESSSY